MNSHHFFPRQTSRYHWLITPLFALLLLGGCGGKEDNTRQPQTGSPTLSYLPRQEVVIGNYHEPTSLDPQQISSSNDMEPIRDLLEGLVLHGANGSLIPAVAERWQSSDAQNYTFHLRPDARWSNGEPVTAGDFVYAWRRAVDPATASDCAEEFTDTKVANASAIVAGKASPQVLGVRATSAHTLEVTLEQPVGYFTEVLINRCFLPLHASVIEQYGSSWTRPEHFIGNGAFSLKAWSVNESLVLHRNPMYRDADKVRLEQVTYLPIASAQAELRRYLADEVDITFSAPSEHIEKLRTQRPGELLQLLQPMTFGIEINHTAVPFDNRDVRKALALALDRQLLVDKVLKIGKPAYRLTPPTVPFDTGNHHPWVTQSQEEREALARDLYTKAGFSRENPLRFRIFHKNNDNTHKVLLAATTMWKQVLGAEVTVQGFELKSLIPLIQQLDFELSTRGIRAGYPDASAVLTTVLTGRRLANGYSNPAFDQLLNDAMRLQDTQARARAFSKAEHLLAEDMPFIPLYNRGVARLVKTHVRGYQPSPLGYRYSKDLWIAQQAQSQAPPMIN